MTDLSILSLFVLLILVIMINIKHFYLKNKFKNYDNLKLKVVFYIKLIILICICIFISLSFSNFKWGYKRITNYATFIDNIIIMDYSTSMLANDIKPTRFDTAKNLSLYLINNSNNCRFALIIFGNDPLLEVPLTDNLNHLANVIKSLQLNDEYYRSSNIKSAILTAINLLERSPAFYKNIILLSDFDIEKNLNIKIKNLIKNKITKFYSIVISMEKEIKIWLPSKKSYLLDSFQNEVYTSYNSFFLADISKLPNANIIYWKDYYYNSISHIINNNKNLSLKMEKHETMIQKELNYLFALTASLLIIIYLIISSTLKETFIYLIESFKQKIDKKKYKN